jgi:hypothetical protein
LAFGSSLEGMVVLRTGACGGLSGVGMGDWSA